MTFAEIKVTDSFISRTMDREFPHQILDFRFMRNVAIGEHPRQRRDLPNHLHGILSLLHSIISSSSLNPGCAFPISLLL